MPWSISKSTRGEKVVEVNPHALIWLEPRPGDDPEVPLELSSEGADELPVVERHHHDGQGDGHDETEEANLGHESGLTRCFE